MRGELGGGGETGSGAFLLKQWFAAKALHLNNSVKFSLIITTAMDFTACSTCSRSALHTCSTYHLLFCVLFLKPEIVHIISNFSNSYGSLL